MPSKWLIESGADEIACTLFARAFCDIKDYVPEISLRYSSIHGPFVIPRYEDRSLGESIKAHITAAGDELELEQPETLDEYVDVLHQFKEHYNNVGYIMTDQLGRIAPILGAFGEASESS